MSNTIRWYESVELDAPELNSPQPCPRGIHCNYMVNNSGVWGRGCCRGVHPGEEGTGRRIFPARTTDDGREQPACVRLTGRADYYERRRLRISWGQWCQEHDIPYEPIKPGEEWEPVVRSPLGGRRRDVEEPKEPAPKPSKNQRKRAKRRLPPALGTAEQEEEAAAERERDSIYTADEMIHMQVEQSLIGIELRTRACEDLEAELRAGAHSPKPAAAPPRLNLSERFFGSRMPTNGFRSGECSPDCSCPDGWTCGDRTESRRSGACTPGMAAASAAANSLPDAQT